ncbi:MAG: hypothetical protein IH884_09925, partial [Myxococcales bacterium]|nr:hypothetical protein [Myxococcales bacterium]
MLARICSLGGPLLASVSGFVLLFLSFPATSAALPAPIAAWMGGICTGTGDIVNNGCPGCTTTITLACSDGAVDCQPCTYSWTASLSCPPVQQNGSGMGQVECGGKFERRFGGCGTGPAWGGVV